MLRTTLRFIGTLPGMENQAVGYAYYYVRQNNNDEALFWYQHAAKHGYINSYFQYGKICEEQKKDESRALIAYFKGAVRGDKESLAALQRFEAAENEEAIFYLGIIAESKHEWVQALNYYKRSASKNYAEAMYRAGCLYQQDRFGSDREMLVINKDEAQEVAWFKKGAALHNAKALDALYVASQKRATACLALAKLYEEGEGRYKSKERMLEFYLKADELGDGSAAFKLGGWHENGTLPIITKDIKKAGQYYLKAAKQNYAGALAALECLATVENDAQLEFEIGNVYHNVSKNISVSLLWYKKAADKNHTQAATLLQQIATSNDQQAYEIGCLYESNSPANLSQALRYYLIAAKKGYANAKSRFEALANSGNSDAQYMWGYEYCLQQKGNTLEAVKWCLKAAEKNHAQALHYLNTTVFTAEVYFEIACRYEIGKDGIVVNIQRARQFYEKANQLQHAQAAFCLATLLIKSAQPSSLTAANITTALQFYLTAALRKYTPALDCAVKLVEQSLHSEHAYQLAQYFEKNKDILTALRWYMAAAHLGENAGTKCIEDLAKGSREYSLFVADAYQKGTYGIKSSQLAYYYYAIAACLGEQRALVHLQTLAKEGNDQAQYVLGTYYYHSRQEFDQAITWCLRAAKQENNYALRYLNETDFPIKALIILGNVYESGNDIVEANPKKAKEYYEKAWRKGDSQAAYLLGRLALDYPQDPGEPFNLQAWDYLLAAAKKGNQSALPPLERMALMATSSQQKQLADVYSQASALPYSQLQVVKWREQVAIASSSSASISLRPALPPAMKSPK